MKLKYILYSLLALAAVFMAAMGYLFWGAGDGSVFAGRSQSGSFRALVRDRGKTVSGQPGSLMIAYAGDANGSLGPCGCTQPPMGGMARRATALRDYRRRRPDIPILVVDTGNFTRQTEQLDDPASRWAVEALELVGTQAVHTTLGDLRRLNRLAQLGTLARELKGAFVATNLEPAAGGFSVKSYAIVPASAGGAPLRIGVLAVQPPSEPAPDAGKLLPVEDSIQRHLASVDAQSDLVVLLARLSDSELSRLAALFPAVDVILNGSPSSEGREFPAVGTTQIVESAHGGIALGMIELDWDAAGHVQKARNVMLPLPPQLGDDPVVAALSEKSRADSSAFNAELARRSPAVTAPTIFAGSTQCKDCHEKAYKAWEKSGHARAVHVLERTGDQFNPECVECHVTGNGVAGGFVNLLRTPKLANIQCEQCHGPSITHANKPQEAHPGIGQLQQIRRKVRKDYCLRCHTEENSPRFNFDEYWAKIAH